MIHAAHSDDSGMETIREKSAAQRAAIRDFPAGSHWAAIRDGDMASLEQWVAQTQDIDAPAADPIHLSPLLLALQQRHYDQAALLLRHGANPNQRDLYHSSALLYAYEAGQGESADSYDTRYLQLLLDHSADLLASDPASKTSATLIEIAHQWSNREGVFKVEPKVLAYLVSRLKAVDARWNPGCQTLLATAVKYGLSTQFISELLAAGANANSIYDGYAYEENPESMRIDHFTGTPLRDSVERITYVTGPGFPSDYVTKYLDRQEDKKLLLLRYGADPRGPIGYNKQATSAGYVCGARGLVKYPTPMFTLHIPEVARRPQNHLGLTELLANTAGTPKSFDAILARAQPIAPGEIGYQAMAAAAARYISTLSDIYATQALIARGETSPSPPDANPEFLPYATVLSLLQAQARRLENAMMALAANGANINPRVRVPESSSAFDEGYFSATSDSLLVGTAGLPDEWFERFLSWGASIYLGSFGDHNVLHQTLKMNNARRLALLDDQWELSVKITPWCRYARRELEDYLVTRETRGVPPDSPMLPLVHNYLKRLKQNKACTSRYTRQKARYYGLN